MPEISMELFCLGLMALCAFLFFFQKHTKKRDRVQIMFSRLLVVASIQVSCELAASYFATSRDLLGYDALVLIMIFYLVSLLAFLYIAYLYIKCLINMDVPSLKKIGNWANYLVGGLFFVILMLPMFGLKVEDGSPTFDDSIYFVYSIFLIYEIFILILLWANRKFVNKKRRKIIILAIAVQCSSMLFQAFFSHLFVGAIGVTILTISFYMTLEDEDVKLIDQLALEKENADRANDAKSDFIANVSHEIRTPINAVLGMDEIILRESKDPVVRRYASDIKSAAQTLHGIMNEILDISKIESGKLEITNGVYELNSLLNDTYNFIQLKVKDKKLEFKIDVDSQIPSEYIGDEIRIKQILTNLLTNAVKYTESGGITLRIRGEKGGDRQEILHFMVEDTGRGMKEEDLKNLFQEYQRFDAEKNRNVEGTGLGMSITLQFLRLLGSELKVDSTYGVGSVFSFDLSQEIFDEKPFGELKEPEQRIEEDYTYQNTLEVSNVRVLVVDDNAINRKVFINLLKNTSLDIDEAESGLECISLVKKNVYNLIFMDHMMPEMDGIETFHIIRTMEDNISKDAKVIMLTANAVSGARETYLAEGFDDFIPKPIVPAELEEMIKKYV